MSEAHGRQRQAQSSGIALHEETDQSLVRLWGEVDLEVRRSAGDVCQAAADRALPVIIDAADVTFMDSTGMSILVRLARDGEANGYPVALHHAPWMLRELLSITGVDKLLPVDGGRAASDVSGEPAGEPTQAPSEARD
jgi:anti-anti-sigma factor